VCEAQTGNPQLQGKKKVRVLDTDVVLRSGKCWLAMFLPTVTMIVTPARGQSRSLSVVRGSQSFGMATLATYGGCFALTVDRVLKASRPRCPL
jgi:hypothetical protein